MCMSTKPGRQTRRRGTVSLAVGSSWPSATMFRVAVHDDRATNQAIRQDDTGVGEDERSVTPFDALAHERLVRAEASARCFGKSRNDVLEKSSTPRRPRRSPRPQAQRTPGTRSERHGYSPWPSMATHTPTKPL